MSDHTEDVKKLQMINTGRIIMRSMMLGVLVIVAVIFINSWLYNGDWIIAVPLIIVALGLLGGAKWAKFVWLILTLMTVLLFYAIIVLAGIFIHTGEALLMMLFLAFMGGVTAVLFGNESVNRYMAFMRKER